VTSGWNGEGGKPDCGPNSYDRVARNVRMSTTNDLVIRMDVVAGHYSGT